MIWLSEIILQQTRVEQGLPYFYRFIEQYPDVASFAAASEDDILKLWQGLGYYSRARNMLKTARMVAEDHQGIFPKSYVELIKLKGIGQYTASAIASFAANEARAVVDGNVYRVLARYFGINEPVNGAKGKKLFQAAADELLDRRNPGLHNQAMMEFGAILCKPKNPDCNICPVSINCCALSNETVTALPVKLKTIKVRERFFNYFLVFDGQSILVNKRDEKDIWANMYDLPLIETAGLIDPGELFALPQVIEIFGSSLNILEVSPVVKHVLTHQRLFIRLIKTQNLPVKTKENWVFMPISRLNQLAMPKAMIILLKNIIN